MKVLILSKEFRDGEGVSEYCKNIAEHLVEKGNEVTILSFDDGSYYSTRKEVEVRRVPVPFEGDNIYNWSMILNNELKRQAAELGEEKFDIVHANDWTTVPGGVTLAKHFNKPLLLTVHSTENERGFNEDHSEIISELEWQGVYDADKILTTNEGTKNSVLFDLDAPDEKVEVIDPYTENWRERVLKNYQNLVKQQKAPVNQA